MRLLLFLICKQLMLLNMHLLFSEEG